MKFLVIDFFSKCEQICSFLRVCLHLLKKSLMENAIFCAVLFTKLNIAQTKNVVSSYFKQNTENLWAK